MNKPTATILERCFAAEIDAAFTKMPPIAQLGPSKALTAAVEAKLGGFKDNLGPVTIKGYVLTPAGHYAYCSWAAEQPEEDK